MDEILGLPVHPLVVHAVVVLVPLTTVGLAVAVVSRPWAERLRVVLAGLSVLAAGSAVVARQSGESLLARVPGSAEVARHSDLASGLPWLLVALAVLTVGWAWGHAGGRRYATAAGVAALIAALAATVWTVLAGHSGAVSVWGDLA